MGLRLSPLLLMGFFFGTTVAADKLCGYQCYSDSVDCSGDVVAEIPGDMSCHYIAAAEGRGISVKVDAVDEHSGKSFVFRPNCNGEPLYAQAVSFDPPTCSTNLAQEIDGVECASVRVGCW